MNLPTVGLSTLLASPVTPEAKDSPAKIREAASQFEALLIGEVLKSAQQGQSQGWTIGEEDDQAASSAMDFANEYFARALASKGGLGLSQMITKSLEHAAASSSSPGKLAPGLVDKLPADR